MTDAKRSKEESNEGSGDSGFQESAHQFCCGDSEKMSRMMENCECGDPEKMARMMKNFGCGDSEKMSRMMKNFGCGDPEKTSRMMENCECGDSEKMSRIMKNFRGVMDGSFNLGAMMQRMCGAPKKHDAQ